MNTLFSQVALTYKYNKGENEKFLFFTMHHNLVNQSNSDLSHIVNFQEKNISMKTLDFIF